MPGKTFKIQVSFPADGDLPDGLRGKTVQVEYRNACTAEGALVVGVPYANGAQLPKNAERFADAALVASYVQ